MALKRTRAQAALTEFFEAFDHDHELPDTSPIREHWGEISATFWQKLHDRQITEKSVELMCTLLCEHDFHVGFHPAFSQQIALSPDALQSLLLRTQSWFRNYIETIPRSKAIDIMKPWNATCRNPEFFHDQYQSRLPGRPCPMVMKTLNRMVCAIPEKSPKTVSKLPPSEKILQALNNLTRYSKSKSWDAYFVKHSFDFDFFPPHVVKSIFERLEFYKGEGEKVVTFQEVQFLAQLIRFSAELSNEDDLSWMYKGYDLGGGFYNEPRKAEKVAKLAQKQLNFTHEQSGIVALFQGHAIELHANTVWGFLKESFRVRKKYYMTGKWNDDEQYFLDIQLLE